MFSPSNTVLPNRPAMMKTWCLYDPLSVVSKKLFVTHLLLF